MFSKVSDILSSIKDGSILKFKDREKAAHTLASVLKDSLKGASREEVTVIGIPRGGVIMAQVISQKIAAPSFDIVISRKLSAPHNVELGIGATMQDSTLYLNDYVVNALKVTPEYIEHEKQKQIEEIKRRESLYEAVPRGMKLKEGLLCLLTTELQPVLPWSQPARWIRKQEPKKLIIAIPVVPRETLELLKKEADHVEAVIIPITTNFRSVGQFYEDFSPVSDEDVMKIMKDQK